MQKTSNYNLNKPDYSDVVDIAMLNENADTIDTELVKKLNKTDLPRNVIYCGLAAGNAIAYTAKANPTLTKYEDGVIYIIIPHITCSNNPTLNIDGRGATYLKNSDGDNLLAGDMKANIPYQFVRVSSSFFMCSGKKSDSFGKNHSKNPWKYFGANMPTPRASFGCVEHKSKVYCIGGISGSYTWPIQDNRQVRNTVEIYNIENNTWAQGASLPRNACGMAICIDDVNEKIYVLGGKASIQGDITGEMNVYDIKTNTWTTIIPGMPYASVNPCCEFYDGRIYIFGGDKSSAANFRYTIATNQWDYVEPTPVKRTRTCSVIVDNNIYIFGGVNEYSFADGSIEVYNIITNTWTTLPLGISNHINGSCEYYNGNIYIFGGISDVRFPLSIADMQKEDGEAVSKVVEVFNITSNSIQILPSPPTERDSAKSCVYKDKILFIGGLTYRAYRGDIIQDGITYWGTYLEDLICSRAVEILDCNYDK